MRDQLVIVEPKSFGKGRPPNPVVNRLSIRYVHKTDKKPYYGCRAPSCSWLRSGNAQQDRILRHATSCRHLSSDLKAFANDCAAGGSLGAKLEVMETADAGGETPMKIPATEGSQSVLPLGKYTEKGQKELQARLDHCIMKLICVAGLVPNLLDSKEWREFMAIANPRYKITPSGMFEEKYIPAEAALVRKRMNELLSKSKHLTLTFDGSTTRKPQSVYTVHVTMKDRKSYFIDGCEGSDEHHTALWVKDKVLKVIGPSHHWMPHRLTFIDNPLHRRGELHRGVLGQHFKHKGWAWRRCKRDTDTLGPRGLLPSPPKHDQGY